MNKGSGFVQINTMQIEVVKEKSAQIAAAEKRIINGDLKNIDKNLSAFFAAVETSREKPKEKNSTGIRS